MKNILLILSDQQQRGTLGAYGASQGETPHFDRFASQSAIFENAICTQPVCSPSRASLFSGVYPHEHGVVINNMRLPFRYPTLAERLRDAGYRTGYIGKWHLGNEVLPQRGFEEFWRCVDDNYTAQADRELYGPSAYFQWLRESKAPGIEETINRETASRLPEEFTKAAYVANEACRFLTARKGQPFFLVCAFLEPHNPYHSPYDGYFDRDQIRLPKNFHTAPLPDWPGRNHAYQRFAREIAHSEPAYDDENRWRDVIARYHGLMKLYDNQAGRILAKLDELGLAEETLVIVTSDHGDMMGSHGMIMKGPLFEESLGVPLMMRLPGAIAPGRRIRQAASLVDLYPTVLDALGQEPYRPLHGESLWPLVTSSATLDDLDKPSFGTWNGRIQAMFRKHPFFEPVKDQHARVVRTARQKLVLAPGDQAEFYDLETDPGEMRNRINDPSFKPAIQTLRNHLSAWQERVGDPLELPPP